MTKRSKSPLRPGYVPGTVHANIQIPGHLHEAMKVIRQARHRIEGADVKLSRIYREAVELYLAAEPQQQLLNGKTKSLRNTA